MATILGDDYEPVEVRTLDLVGYLGNEGFVIISPVKSHNRNLPDIGDFFKNIPMCIRAKITNNQVVSFHEGGVATLHDIDGVWHYKWRQEGSRVFKLTPDTFFEIGDCW